MDKKKIGIGVTLIVVLVGVGLVFRPASTSTKLTQAVPNTPRPTVLSYKGKYGIDPVSLLKQRAPIVQNSQGLVTAIGDQKADNTRTGYWQLYVNGKLITTKPGEYITHDDDTIEWKIDLY